MSKKETVDAKSLISHLNGNEKHFWDEENSNFNVKSIIDFFMGDETEITAPLFLFDATKLVNDEIHFIEMKNYVATNFNTSEMIKYINRVSSFFEDESFRKPKKKMILNFMLNSSDINENLNFESHYLLKNNIDGGVELLHDYPSNRLRELVTLFKENYSSIDFFSLKDYINEVLYKVLLYYIALLHKNEVINLINSSNKNIPNVIKITKKYMEKLEETLKYVKQNIDANIRSQISLKNINENLKNTLEEFKVGVAMIEYKKLEDLILKNYKILYAINDNHFDTILKIEEFKYLIGKISKKFKDKSNKIIQRIMEVINDN